MLSIRLAKNIGFCYGFRRAKDNVLNNLLPNLTNTHPFYLLKPSPRTILQLERYNPRIVNFLNSVGENSSLIFSSPRYYRHAFSLDKNKKLKIANIVWPYVCSMHKRCPKLYKIGTTGLIHNYSIANKKLGNYLKIKNPEEIKNG